MYALLQSGCCAVSGVNSHRPPIASSQFVACCQPDDQQRSPQSNPLHLLLPPSSFDSFHRASSKITEPTPVQPIGVISLRGGLLHLRQRQTISGCCFFFTMEIDWYAPATVALSLHSEVMDEKEPTNIRHLLGTVGGLSPPFYVSSSVDVIYRSHPKRHAPNLRALDREKWKGEKNIRQLRIYGPYQCIGLSCIDMTVSPLSVYRQEEEVKKKKMYRGENVGRPWAGVDFEPSPPYVFFFKPKGTLTAIRLNIVELFVTGMPRRRVNTTLFQLTFG